MARVLFITEQFVKDNSPINGNVDDKYITTTIDLCQRKYILPILGTALFDEVSNAINNDTLDSNADLKTLVTDYVQDTLLYYVLSEGIALFTYKIENKSVVKKNSENSSPIDSQEVSMLRDMFKDNAEFFAERTTRYLMEEATPSKYANYLDAGSRVDTIHPSNSNYSTGWVLDDKLVLGNIEVYESEREIYKKRK